MFKQVFVRTVGLENTIEHELHLLILSFCDITHPLFLAMKEKWLIIFFGVEYEHGIVDYSDSAPTRAFPSFDHYVQKSILSSWSMRIIT